MHWKARELALEDDLSELLQHECDHLDGVLAVARAIDGQSFALRSSRNPGERTFKTL
jgi:peptide deformylase